MDQLSVLIVEDNPGDVLLIREYLSDRQDARYDITEVDTLEAAIDLITNREFDVILLDLTLPDSMGLDTVRTVMTISPDTAVIVLTGLQDENTALQAVRYGAQDYLEKQFLAPAMLYKSIIYAIERKRAMQEKEDLLNDLTKALEKIETLEGILPVCVSCRKILDENQEWHSLEEYILHRSDAEVVQLVCPACMRELEQNENPDRTRPPAVSP
ncbi:MAG: response regulator [Desulfobulbaceae bacterium]|jgi:CheY-like chemotaxis protein|nr:response regulator [Desulfobulbaceae bacterium]MDY0351351.1 response regulator [Desulfobulbaceae bacterium]